MRTYSATSVVLARIVAREGYAVTALPLLYEPVDPETLGSVLESDADVTVRFVAIASWSGLIRSRYLCWGNPLERSLEVDVLDAGR